jgi:hypothetical protein
MKRSLLLQEDHLGLHSHQAEEALQLALLEQSRGREGGRVSESEEQEQQQLKDQTTWNNLCNFFKGRNFWESL